ncbi:glycosyltransferase [Glaciihabitans arcticus]|uniref:glycosyltransferase n=1 Tax=Glaciihabitans arcticus TaxID=2668039 RepID=UPI0013872605|nr:glycosyltransferase [Glaciihabitans arcticus]
MTDLSGLHVAVVSRIYLPEPAAASFRLGALARALRDAGATTTVLTTAVPAEYSTVLPGHDAIDVRRFPVLRDAMGYVRGYVQYMSFDIPAMFRVLFRRHLDVVVVEPPPTTGFFMRIACAIRRVPYVYYAADIWSDAVESTDAPAAVARVVRVLERWAIRGAAEVVSASPEFTERMHELFGDARITTIGNGVDTTSFGPSGARKEIGAPYLLYAGTASEVHGAVIFMDAFARVLESEPQARLVFVGQGAERDELERRAGELPAGSVHFEPRLSSDEVSAWIRGARATLASVRPEGYHRAFPTKMYASAACGTRVVYAGSGPGRDFAGANGMGWAVDYEVDAVAAAMLEALRTDATDEQREGIARWAVDTVSLGAVAARAVTVVGSVARRRERHPD